VDLVRPAAFIGQAAALMHYPILKDSLLRRCSLTGPAHVTIRTRLVVEIVPIGLQLFDPKSASSQLPDGA
jgi:hypothetical protein